MSDGADDYWQHTGLEWLLCPGLLNHVWQYQKDAHLGKPKTGKSHCGNTIAGW